MLYTPDRSKVHQKQREHDRKLLSHFNPPNTDKQVQVKPVCFLLMSNQRTWKPESLAMPFINTHNRNR